MTFFLFCFLFYLVIIENKNEENWFCCVVWCIQEFVGRLNLQRDQEVLDVGCGIGGSAFYMANVSINHRYSIFLLPQAKLNSIFLHSALQ